MTKKGIIDILTALKQKGFAATNISFGIGSWFQVQNSRDTFGFKYQISEAVLAKEYMTNYEIIDVYKTPKDPAKQSLKGQIQIFKSGTFVKKKSELSDYSEYSCNYPLKLRYSEKSNCKYKTTLSDIRDKLWNGEF